MTLLLVTLLVWSQVEFRTTDGDSVVGELRGWNDEAIRVECEGATRQIPLERLQLWRRLTTRTTDPTWPQSWWNSARDPVWQGRNLARMTEPWS